MWCCDSSPHEHLVQIWLWHEMRSFEMNDLWVLFVINIFCPLIFYDDLQSLFCKFAMLNKLNNNHSTSIIFQSICLSLNGWRSTKNVYRITKYTFYFVLLSWEVLKRPRIITYTIAIIFILFIQCCSYLSLYLWIVIMYFVHLGFTNIQFPSFCVPRCLCFCLDIVWMYVFKTNEQTGIIFNLSKYCHEFQLRFFN